MVLCAVRDEAKLASWIDKLTRKDIRFITWTEPDRDNELTAIATEMLSGKQRRLLRDLQLMKGECSCGS